jgi:hypothetical protein
MIETLMNWWRHIVHNDPLPRAETGNERSRVGTLANDGTPCRGVPSEDERRKMQEELI